MDDAIAKVVAEVNRKVKAHFVEVNKGIVSRLSPEGLLEREKWLERKQEMEERRRNCRQVEFRKHLRNQLYNRLLHALKGKSNVGSMKKNMGCNIQDFMDHIARLFQPGMSWKNWGKWHLDHIQPLYSFDLADPEQLAKAAHYTNIRPLWAKENLGRPRPDYRGKNSLNISENS